MRHPSDTRYQRQHAFRLEDRRFIRATIASQPWAFYDNANLSIHVTDKCNADCSFCVAHLRYANRGRAYTKEALHADEAYLAALRAALAATSSIAPSVSITGGEPTVNRRLPAILDTVAAAGARKRTLTTNGSGLLENMAGCPVIERLGDYRLEHLNISRAHHDDTRNAALMQMQPDLLPTARLTEAVTAARTRGMQVRLSCVLLQDGIRDLDGMQRYADWAFGRIGADTVIFRELMTLDRRATLDGRIPAYCDQQRVPLGPLWEALDAQPGFQRVHQVLGYYYYVEVWRSDGGRTWVAEAADLGRIHPQRAACQQRFGMPTAFEMVFHPNGNLCAGWIEDEDIILAGAAPCP